MTEHAGLTARLRRTLRTAAAVCQRLPLCPELSLYLLNPDYPDGPLPPKQRDAVWQAPAYWAFCWAGGQVLARRLLDRPGEVRGLRVLDFGCGSGVVAVAAARAGAAEAIACDLDPDARAAARANAALNGVRVTVCGSLDEVSLPVDVVLAADVLYDPANAAWLDRFLEWAPRVLVADCRVHDLGHAGYARVGEVEACTVPDLDPHGEFRRVTLYAARQGSFIPPG